MSREKGRASDRVAKAEDALPTTERSGGTLSREELRVEIRREAHAVLAESFSGPLPHPEHFERYEKTLPGAADRILPMAEEQGEHRRRLEKVTIESRTRQAERAQWIAASLAGLVMTGGLVVMGLGQSIAGAATGCPPGGVDEALASFSLGFVRPRRGRGGGGRAGGRGRAGVRWRWGG